MLITPFSAIDDSESIFSGQVCLQLGLSSNTVIIFQPESVRKAVTAIATGCYTYYNSKSLPKPESGVLCKHMLRSPYERRATMGLGIHTFHAAMDVVINIITSVDPVCRYFSFFSFFHVIVQFHNRLIMMEHPPPPHTHTQTHEILT